MLINRGDIITAICTHLRTAVPEFNLVKPYNGEIDRYSKKTQLQEETFPAMVNLTTPFALVISKDRKKIEGKGSSLRFKHDISIYIGDANTHDFSSTTVPNIISLLDRCRAGLRCIYPVTK